MEGARRPGSRVRAGFSRAGGLNLTPGLNRLLSCKIATWHLFFVSFLSIPFTMSSSSSRNGNDTHVSDPLPPGWTRAYSKSNKKYYYAHAATGVTQWHFPTAREVQDPQLAQKRAAEAKEREQQRKQQSSKRAKYNNAASEDDDDEDDWDARSVAIIVPFRDLHPEQNRSAHLQQFIPHMLQFLATAKGIRNYGIYIVEQSDDGRKFNRGKLLNVGFDHVRRRHSYDVFIFHDVDLLPADNLQKWYAQFPSRPLHIARVWDRYSNNPKYFGGVVSFSKSDYQRINGCTCVGFLGWLLCDFRILLVIVTHSPLFVDCI